MRRVFDAHDIWKHPPDSVAWPNRHHIVFWASGGETKLSNLVLLCYHHHRQVHEGGWQVVRAGGELRFVPPEQMVPIRARGPGVRWAA